MSANTLLELAARIDNEMVVIERFDRAATNAAEAGDLPGFAGHIASLLAVVSSSRAGHRAGLIQVDASGAGSVVTVYDGPENVAWWTVAFPTADTLFALGERIDLSRIVHGGVSQRLH